MDNLERNEKLKELIELLPGGVGIYHVYIDGTIELVYLNDDYYVWLGVPREQRLMYAGDSTIQAIHPDDHAAVKAATLEAVSNNKKTTVTCRIVCSKDDCRWVNIRIKPVSKDEDKYTVYALFTDIDELKKLQLQLINNQKSVELAQKQGNISIWTYNIDKGIITQQTPSNVEGHMGYPLVIPNVPASFIEQGSIYKEDEDKFIQVYTKLANGAEKADEIYRLMNKNTGKYDWVHMYYQTISNEENSERMAVGFSVVVNQQQHNLERYYAEKNLRKKLFVNAIQYYEVNLTQKVVENYEMAYDDGINTYDENIDSTEYFEQKMSTYVEESFIDEMSKMYSDNLLQAYCKGVLKVVCQYRRKETYERPAFWTRTTAILVQKPDVNEVMAFIYVEDIDQEKKFRMALESTMEAGIESVALINAKTGEATVVRENAFHPIDGKFIYNDSFIQKAHAVVVEDEGEAQYAKLSHVIGELERNEQYQFSISIRQKDGEIRRKVFRYKYLDEHKEDLIIAIIDATELYRDEQNKKQQLERAVEQAVSANKEKTDFFSRMSHDIRTPLNVIIGMSRIAQGNDNPVDTQDCLDKIKISSEFLLGLINDVLDMERIESGRIELHPVPYTGIEFKGYIETVIEPLCKQKNIMFSYGTDAKEDFIVIQDKLRINQIYFNILSNAVKFTPEGGQIQFHTKIRRVSDRFIAMDAKISDNGIGMSEEFQKHMFDTFTQENQEESSVRQGTGLGLAIVKRMCDLMGMTISVESKVGEGTTFYLHGEYQVADNEIDTDNSGKAAESYDLAVLRDKMVLVCEDHMLNQEIIRRLLENQGMIPVLMEDGQKGLNAFMQSSLNEYAAILMDIRMPLMDGLETTRKIRALDREDAKSIPIIAMTANAFDSDIEEALAAGMNVHLAKPIEPELLYKIIAEQIAI